MYTNEITIRVRYAETDRMGYVYYGNYAAYLEVARVEALRNLGFTYKKLEDEGIMLPVLDYSIKYIRPALYDDLLTVITKITSLPAARINFEYEIYNDKDILLSKAATTLVFINRNSNKPVAGPPALIEALRKYGYS
jgi:acyl-CoA thioester hydrolase